MAHIVISGLGGEEAARKVKLSELLPYKPGELFGQTETECKPRTIQVLKRLIKDNRIPLFVIPVIKDEIEMCG